MEKILILTNFMEFNPGNSLTGIVKDQISMLAQYGHEVHVGVNDKYHGEEMPNMIRILPFFHLKDYSSLSELLPEHNDKALQTADTLWKAIDSHKFDIVITHDIMFQGWFMPYSLGVSSASTKLPNVKWLHWVHSIPSTNRDWWRISFLRPEHKMVYPNSTYLYHVAHQFKGTVEDCRCVHHIKDLRSWFDFSEDVCEFIQQVPAVMRADVVQVYPASSDRLGAKRLGELINIFGAVKAQGLSVCLVVANQWATTLTRKEDIKHYELLAQSKGLEVGKEFIFTSTFKSPKYDIGVPKQFVRELLLMSNLFIFPTRDESFGLVMPEASLTGGCLLVLNKSLEMMEELSGGNALFYEFGSFSRPFVNLEGEGYYRKIAKEVVARVLTDESLRSKSFIRQTYNWNALYENEYRPLFDEAKTWGTR